MNRDDRQPTEDDGAVEPQPSAALGKRRYSRPMLQDLGPVMQHTLAPTPGLNESGNELNFQEFQ